MKTMTIVIGVISILILSGTAINASALVTKYAIYLGNVTKFTSLNADNTMWNNTRFGTSCFTPDSKNG
jgi:hypothetical protein